MVSVYLGGHELDRFPIRAGQYVNVRFLTDGWWRSHPYRSRPTQRGAGCASPSRRWATTRRGPRPSDRHASHRGGAVRQPHRRAAHGRRVLLLAAGIGVTPLRALLEEFSVPGARHPAVPRPTPRRSRVQARDGPARHRARRPGAVLRRVAPGGRSEHRARRRRDAPVRPDVAAHDVYVCGPDAFMDDAAATARALGVPAGRIHQERSSLDRSTPP